MIVICYPTTTPSILGSKIEPLTVVDFVDAAYNIPNNRCKYSTITTL